MSDYETVTLERDGAKDLQFEGREIAHVTSRKIDGPGSSRWTELHLYQTRAGVWVCHERGLTQWNGERDRNTVYIADTDEALFEQVGMGWLAKHLYAEAGIEPVERLE